MAKHTLLKPSGAPTKGTVSFDERGQVQTSLTEPKVVIVQDSSPAAFTGSVEKGLTERFVNLHQVPHELDLNFTGDVTTNTGVFQTELVQPVRPSPVQYLPMEIRLLPPKIPIDFVAVQARNQKLNSAFISNGIGDALVLSDSLMDQALDYQLVIDTIKQAEPLVFYINPNDLNRQYARKVTEQIAGGGHIVEHWGEEQDRLSANGKIGAAYTSSTGLTRFFRRNSASYQQLMHLYIIYRNNGYVYEVLDTRRISLVGAVQITYDSEIWIGSFDSFSMTENADNPYTMEYSFEFTAREYYSDESLSTGSTVRTSTQTFGGDNTRAAGIFIPTVTVTS